MPPSLAFDPSVAARFFDDLARSLAGPIVCEPRHPGWFETAADALLTAHHIARVAADPARVAGADRPGGWPGLRYMRWHGAPQVYRSAYDDAAIDRHADAARCGESWTIYDNTAAGAAPANALTLMARLAGQAKLFDACSNRSFDTPGTRTTRSSSPRIACARVPSNRRQRASGGRSFAAVCGLSVSSAIS